MTKIVMSYRRDDTKAATRMLFDRLAQHFGRNSVFLDFDTIGPGDDFREHIDRVLRNSDFVLAMIGPRWRGAKRGAKSRLMDAADWVRVEIETALESGVKIIPVLVDGGAMPKPDQLPESIRRLAYLNAVKVDTGPDFQAHCERLIRWLDRRQTSNNPDSEFNEGDRELSDAASAHNPTTATSTSPTEEQPVPPASVRGIDVVREADVTLEEAVWGGQRTYEMSDGRTVTAAIAKGVRDGEKILFSGLGEAGKFGGANGDLVLMVRVLAEPPYAIEGNDIRLDYPITDDAAMLGGRRRLPPPFGTIEFGVPQNTSQNKVLRLKGRGLPARESWPEGDLYVRLKIVPGTKPENGNDIVLELGISLEEAISGASRTLSLPDGRQIAVQVPPGIRDQETIVLNGQGEPGKSGGKAGNARVNIKVLPHPNITVDGNDLAMDLPVTAELALAGGLREIATPRGVCQFKVPPDSIDGRAFRLKGRGLPARGAFLEGDLYVLLRISPSLNPDPVREGGFGRPNHTEPAGRNWRIQILIAFAVCAAVVWLAIMATNSQQQPGSSASDSSTSQSDQMSAAPAVPSDTGFPSNSAQAPAPAPAAGRAIDPVTSALQNGDAADAKKDYRTALAWYQKAAAAGNAEAQNDIGWYYKWGHGVGKDLNAAFAWFSKAGNQGNVSAEINLGLAYLTGEGVAENDSEALRWYRKAASQGDATGFYDVGYMYATGYGVAQDVNEARKWMVKAAAKGDADAKKWLVSNPVSKSPLQTEQGAEPMDTAASKNEQAPAVRTFIVFFDYGSNVLTDKAGEVVTEAARSAKTNNFAACNIDGNTDTAESADPQIAARLGFRRAQATEKFLAAEGYTSTITTADKGDADPLVPTGQNTREPQNRRAVIDCS